jgi:hypothetical protein
VVCPIIRSLERRRKRSVAGYGNGERPSRPIMPRSAPDRRRQLGEPLPLNRRNRRRLRGRPLVWLVEAAEGSIVWSIGLDEAMRDRWRGEGDV